jgi:hypothetical protein
MKAMHLGAAALTACSLATSASAFSTDKITMKNNMAVTYKETPKNVDSFFEMFSEGMVYGRLRSNTFYWNWQNENPYNPVTNSGNTKDNFAWGVGGSLLYSTGFLDGFGATAGFYTTYTLFTDNGYTKADGTMGDYGKAGKDTYARLYGSGANIDVLALAYLEYKFAKTDIKYGRQIFESTLLKSNDTKMIPNTFQGIAIESRDVEKTKLRAAYFYLQKLRDHRTFHSIIAYDSTAPHWQQNDDAAVHKGLNTNNLQAAGKNAFPGMFVATVENTSVRNLKLNLDGMYIPEYFGSIIAEANYAIKAGDWVVTPGARYFQQIDDGAGAVGGAALSGKLAMNQTPTAAQTASYTDPTSVDGAAWMVRLIANRGPLMLGAGYSKILNQADLIAPWRGFPTGGYTRGMAQYNWEANTASYMVKTGYDFGKANMVPGLYTQLNYAFMDYDQTKLDAGTISKSDRHIVHLDVVEALPSVPNLYMKFRTSIVSAEQSPNTAENFNSYAEYRFQLDYFF